MHQDAGSIIIPSLLNFRMVWYSYLGLLNIRGIHMQPLWEHSRNADNGCYNICVQKRAWLRQFVSPWENYTSFKISILVGASLCESHLVVQLAVLYVYALFSGVASCYLNVSTHFHHFTCRSIAPRCPAVPYVHVCICFYVCHRNRYVV